MNVLNSMLLGAVLVLYFADVATTLRALDLGGRELNRLLLWLMARIGVAPALLATKAPAVVLALLVAPFEWANVVVAVVPTWWLLLALAAFYALVLASNARVLGRLGRGNGG